MAPSRIAIRRESRSVSAVRVVMEPRCSRRDRSPSIRGGGFPRRAYSPWSRPPREPISPIIARGANTNRSPGGNSSEESTYGEGGGVYPRENTHEIRDRPPVRRPPRDRRRGRDRRAGAGPAGLRSVPRHPREPGGVLRRG